MSHAGPKKFAILATCTGGHGQKVVYDGLERAHVEDLARLLDGTSPLYVHSPRDPKMPGSVIGRCGICGALINCTVEEVTP